MKKLLILVLSLIAVLSLFACGSSMRITTSDNIRSVVDNTESESVSNENSKESSEASSADSDESSDISDEVTTESQSTVDSQSSAESQSTVDSPSSAESQEATSEESSNSSEESSNSSEEELTDRLVEFNVNGGRLLQSVQTGGEQITLPTPYKYGYEFLGWYEDADFNGEGLFGAYKAYADVTLHAKWQQNPDMVYVYLYGGADNFDEVILSYKKGDTVNLSDLIAVVPTAVVRGTVCPFVNLYYEVHNAMATGEDFGEVVPDSFVITEDTVLLAEYDASDVVPLNHITQDPDGTWVTTGYVIYSFATGTTPCGVFSCKFVVSKSMSGQVGVAFRMTRDNRDYGYEHEGNSYYDVVIGPSGGYMGIYQTWAANNSAWARIQSDIPLTSLPLSWQQKYASADQIQFTMTVVSYPTYFEVYLDGDLAYTSTIDMYLTGKDFGIRSNISGVIISDIFFKDGLDPVTVSFNTNGGTPCAPVSYLAGKIDLPESEKDGLCLRGWFYDEACTQKVDPATFKTAEDIVLYADWKPAVFFQTNGGNEMEPMYYYGTPLDIPDGTYEYMRFLGWYTNPEFSGTPINQSGYVVTTNVTLYAKWEVVPKIYLQVNGGDEMAPIGYYGTPLEIPDGTYENMHFDGWYTNSDFTGDPINQSEYVITSDVILYAKWSEVTHKNVVDNGDGSYTTKGAASKVVLSAKGTSLVYSIDVTFKKSMTGGGGLLFRGNIISNNVLEGGNSKYLAVVVVPASGNFQISKTTPSVSFAHLVGASTLTLAKMPQSWQDKYNSVTDVNEYITVNITVYDYGTYFDVYIDGVLAVHATADISDFTNTGVGFRASKTGYTLSGITVSKMGASTGEYANKSNNFAHLTATVSRDTQGVTFYFTGTKKLNGNCEVYMDVGNFGASRNAKNIYFNLQDSGVIGVTYWLNGTATAITDIQGLEWEIYANSDTIFNAKFFVSYEYLSRVLSTTVASDAKIAFSLGQWSTTANDWDGWGFNGEFVAPEVPSKYVVLSTDNKLS